MTQHKTFRSSESDASHVVGSSRPAIDVIDQSKWSFSSPSPSDRLCCSSKSLTMSAPSELNIESHEAKAPQSQLNPTSSACDKASKQACHLIVIIRIHKAVYFDLLQRLTRSDVTCRTNERLRPPESPRKI